MGQHLFFLNQREPIGGTRRGSPLDKSEVVDAYVLNRSGLFHQSTTKQPKVFLHPSRSGGAHGQTYSTLKLHSLRSLKSTLRAPKRQSPNLQHTAKQTRLIFANCQFANAQWPVPSCGVLEHPPDHNGGQAMDAAACPARSWHFGSLCGRK